MRVLALDYGAARTGVAVSDASGTLARPVCVVRKAATESGLAEVARLVTELEAEQVVVGLPLTLRGEHGKQAAETELFVTALRRARRRAGRDRRRALHDRACAALRRQGARGCGCGSASAPELARPQCARRQQGSRMRRLVAVVAASAGAAARRRLRWRWRRLDRGRDDDRAAGREPPHHLPGGAQRPRDGRPRRRRARDRDREARRHAEADPRRVPRGRQARSAAEDLPPRLEARLAGGLPLPGALRLHPVHDRQRARLRPARGIPQELRPRQPRVCALEEPDAVRRAQDRLDDREGDGGTGRAEARRGGDLQPAAPEDAARHRRNAPLRPEHPGHRVADQGCDREQQPLQQPEVHGPAADAGGESRASPRSRPPHIRPRWTTSTTSAFPARSGTSSPRARARSCARCASTGTPAAEASGSGLRQGGSGPSGILPP